jgi:hypothetical protein
MVVVGAVVVGGVVVGVVVVVAAHGGAPAPCVTFCDPWVTP